MKIEELTYMLACSTMNSTHRAEIIKQFTLLQKELEEAKGLLKEACKIIRASSPTLSLILSNSRNLVKDWDKRTTQALSGKQEQETKGENSSS